MVKKVRHPVWDVYDEYRDTLYYVKAHRTKIQRLSKFNRWLDIAIAIFTPSSAVAGIFFWDTQAGRIVWNILISLASVLAVSKPLLKFDKQVKALIISLGGYTRLLHDLEDLKTNIRQEGCYDDKLKSRFMRIRNKKRKIYQNTALIELSEKEQAKLFNEVKRKAPVDRFFIPEDTNASTTNSPTELTSIDEVPSS